MIFLQVGAIFEVTPLVGSRLTITQDSLQPLLCVCMYVCMYVCRNLSSSRPNYHRLSSARSVHDVVD